jgi:outer membrane lipoprotein-sorting protein
LNRTLQCSIPTRRGASFTLAAAALPLLLTTTGCMSLLTSKRKLLVPIAPATVQNASADELVARLNDQWSKFESLTATVEIRASHLKTKEGVATDYPTFRANLLLRKPDMLRIRGNMPVIQTNMFDLGSDGKVFTLVVPPVNKAYQGLNSSVGSSPNWYENLRPSPLFNAMVVRGLNPEELYSVISESVTEEDSSDKHLLLHPEYVLSIVRSKPGTQEQIPIRVVRFHREDLLPYQQDLYDDKGTLATQVIYGKYKDFDGVKYPGTITMRRPQDEYQLIMSVERVAANPVLTDDMFQVKIPPDFKIQHMD